MSRKFTESQSTLSSKYYKRYLSALGVMPYKRTLDIGCGWGFMSEYFEGDYIGVDLSEEKIQFARRVYGSKFAVQNILDRDFLGNERFKQILVFTVLDEIDFKQQTLLKISNHLEDDGLLYVEVRNAGFVVRGLLKAAGFENRRTARISRMGRNESDLNAKQYADLFDSCGLDILKQYKATRPLVSSSLLQLCKKIIYLCLDRIVPTRRCFMLGFILRKRDQLL
jgi:SAM-dependent methyltransferase